VSIFKKDPYAEGEDPTQANQDWKIPNKLQSSQSIISSHEDNEID